MSHYLGTAMRLYLDHLVDWEALLSLQRSERVDLDAEVGAFRTILETAAQLAASFEEPARKHWHAEASLTDDGGATSPPHIRAAYEQLRKAGLVSLPIDEEYGGYGLPTLLNGMVIEMISRADPSLMMIVGLQTGAASDIQKYGSEEVKRKWLPRFTAGDVEGSMDLTEPQAGSDLGGIATRATETEDGRLRVDGQKIFISNGGAEVHLVLARDDDSYDASKGTTKGLSLILVPRHKDDGSPNGVTVTRLERKLGIHGSATCEVVFDDAEGVRLGKQGQGFRAMLDLMNAARLGVASQAVGLASAALHDAREYAKQRKQFGVPIAEQPLVKTMLARMTVNLEAARALLYRTYGLLDRNIAREAALGRDDLSAAARAEAEAGLERDSSRVRLLTPLCKYHATEICDEITRDAMQVFGGVGFTMDSDVGKYHADSLIMTVYEGTSEIQASFALKEIGKGALNTVFKQIRDELAEMQNDPERAELAKQVLEMTHRIDQAGGVLFQDIGYALMRAKLLTQMVIDVTAATELLHQAGADSERRVVAEAFIARCSLGIEHMARRIEVDADTAVDRDAAVLALEA
ncbi:MAG: acyl-CoA dehydrogenase family protein [Deltaproteobacteria bacterium]|nr:acyl-CoA dehydrogenase family protein [Deltaproteobacteria bacterium]MBW2360912.1 acyl-CoA dehydrogenase family protein [Deltaproteobacteria bacterium]